MRQRVNTSQVIGQGKEAKGKEVKEEHPVEDQKDIDRARSWSRGLTGDTPVGLTACIAGGDTPV